MSATVSTKRDRHQELTGQTLIIQKQNTKAHRFILHNIPLLYILAHSYLFGTNTNCNSKAVAEDIV